MLDEAPSPSGRRGHRRSADPNSTYVDRATLKEAHIRQLIKDGVLGAQFLGMYQDIAKNVVEKTEAWRAANLALTEYIFLVEDIHKRVTGKKWMADADTQS